MLKKIKKFFFNKTPQSLTTNKAISLLLFYLLIAFTVKQDGLLLNNIIINENTATRDQIDKGSQTLVDSNTDNQKSGNSKNILDSNTNNQKPDIIPSYNKGNIVTTSDFKNQPENNFTKDLVDTTAEQKKAPQIAKPTLDNLQVKILNLVKKAKFNKKHSNPKLVVVIDDFGYNINKIHLFLKLKQNINFAVLPNLPDSLQITNLLHKNNKTVVLHLPMEPKNSKLKLEKTTLMVNDSKEEISKKISQSRQTTSFINGISNHMGSHFTSNEDGMLKLMLYLKNTNLFFLDSKTARGKTAAKLATQYQVPYYSRDVFLDNSKDPIYIARQLISAAKISFVRGRSIAIGHPYKNTYKVLNILLPELEKRGVQFQRL